MFCCCAVCVSYLNDEHLTCYWKEEFIFPKNILFKGSICFNFPFQKEKIFAVQTCKTPKETPSEPSASNPSISATLVALPGPHYMVTKALLRWLQSLHFIPNWSYCFQDFQVDNFHVEARMNDTWMLLVAQASLSKLSHAYSLLPRP